MCLHALPYDEDDLPRASQTWFWVRNFLQIIDTLRTDLFHFKPGTDCYSRFWRPCPAVLFWKGGENCEVIAKRHNLEPGGGSRMWVRIVYERTRLPTLIPAITSRFNYTIHKGCAPHSLTHTYCLLLRQQPRGQLAWVLRGWVLIRYFKLWQ